MKKIILASAISALFAAPVVAFAQAKPPAVPTLDKIFEASGITVSGYIDAGYSYANRNIEGNGTPQPGATIGTFQFNGVGNPPTVGVSTRVFDSQNNSFALHQVGLTVAKQPKEGFGGLVNLTMGKDAQVIHSFPDSVASTFDVTQAYAQWAGGPLTVIAGKFTTLHGTEVIASPGNTNISRSILFGSVPFTHTGVRATWALSDTFALIAGVNNGWDQLTDSNRGKTLELGATLNPIKPLSITISGYSGKETIPLATPNSATEGVRTSGNLVASWAFSDAFSVGFEYLNVSQDKVPHLAAAGTFKGKYSGYAGYLTMTPTPKWRAVLRLESFDDHDGLRFLTASSTTGEFQQVKYTEGTITLAYLPADSFELRGELRTDKAKEPVFLDFQGNTSKSLTTFALQGLYKF